MRELCEIPGNKCAFHPVYGNWVDSSTQAVFDGSMLPHADKKSVAPFEWIFMDIIWPNVCSRCSCIRKSIFYCTIYGVGVDNNVDMMVKIYIISLIDFP